MTAKPLIYKFDNVLVEAEEFRVLREGRPITLERKAFQVLSFLLERPGRLITKDELLDAIWKDSFVTPNVLTRVVAQLRRTLGDEAQNPRYIETVPTQGYRFIAEVEKVGTVANTSEALLNPEIPDALQEVSVKTSENVYKTESGAFPVPETFWASRKGAVALGLCVLLVTAGIGYFVGFRIPANNPSSQSPPDNTIAILPFKLLDRNDDNNYLSVGLTDSLITKLSNVRSLTVRPTVMVLRYATEGTEPAKAGLALGVQSVISGTVQRIDDRVRVNIQMTRVSDGKPVWANSYDAQFVNIFQVQDEISARIMDSLKIRLNKDEQTRLDRRPTENIEAFQLCLRAIYFLNKLNPDDLKTSINYFNEAIALDPNYALAYARLANAYGIASSFNFPSAQQLNESAALKAVALDPTLGEAHTSLAVVQYWGYHDIGKAQDSFVHALELDPNSVYTHEYYGWFLIAIGHFDEAERQLTRALELGPFEPRLQVNLALPLFFERRYKESVDILRNILKPNDSVWYVHMSLGFACEGAGDLVCAVSELRRAVKLSPQDPAVKALLARALAFSGQRDESRQILAQIEADNVSEPSYYYVALAYIALDERDAAFARLEKANENKDKWLGWLKVDPRLDPIRQDPRFDDLLVKTKLK